MINVGLVGYGFMGKMHAQCYQATGRARIAAVVDVEPDRRDAAKAKLGCETYTSIPDMVAGAGIDLIDVCTPTYLHEECVVAAAQAGKDIMCEKPMALTVESCDRMIDAVNKAGVKMMVGHVIRFWPEYQVVKDIVDSGKYGKVQWVSAIRLGAVPTYAWQGWLVDPKRSGGAIHDLHIHDLDYFTYLIGRPKRMLTRGIAGAQGGLDSVLTTGWEHESGVTSFAEGSLALAPEYPFTMSLLVVCKGATIRLDSGSDPSLMVYPTEGEPFAPELPEAKVGSSEEDAGNISDLGGYYNELEYYVDCLEAGKRPEIVTPESAREAVRICLAARKSAETGQIIDL